MRRYWIAASSEYIFQIGSDDARPVFKRLS